LGRQFDVHLVSVLNPGFVERCRFKHVPIAEHATRLKQLLDETSQTGRVAVMPHAAFGLPALDFMPAEIA
jgi:hypothetical protein